MLCNPIQGAAAAAMFTAPLRRHRRAVVLLVVLLVLWLLLDRGVDHVRSEPVRQLLLGRWTQIGQRPDGNLFRVVWEFRPDGTVREYAETKPTPETGRLDDYLQWNVRDGQLVISYDQHFTRQATMRQRVRQVRSYIKEYVWDDSSVPLVREDRCDVIVHGDGGIALELDPSQHPGPCYMPRLVELQRAP